MRKTITIKSGSISVLSAIYIDGVITENDLKALDGFLQFHNLNYMLEDTPIDVLGQSLESGIQELRLMILMRLGKDYNAAS